MSRNGVICFLHRPLRDKNAPSGEVKLIGLFTLEKLCVLNLIFYIFSVTSGQEQGDGSSGCSQSDRDKI